MELIRNNVFYMIRFYGGCQMSASRELFAKSCLVFTIIRGLNLIIEDDIRMHLKSYGLGFSSFRILWINKVKYPRVS